MPPVPPTPPPSIEAEEYAVFSALVRQNPIGYDLGSFIVIREHTALGGDMVEQTLENDERVPAGAAGSYRSRNAKSYTLGSELDLEQDYVLMPQDEWEPIFLQKGALWADFDAMYPEAKGLVTFSRVGFETNGDQALAVMYFRCGDLCGAGGLFLLVKEDGNWVVQEELLSWMS